MDLGYFLYAYICKPTSMRNNFASIHINCEL
ncbi:ankyrin repeat domain 42 (predicted), isoform CRA_b [Rattus norvegicus]|uniref:Ankyrin repeat domain 42 (Predicted), isoform CRA_b n=1 Tax=Rattus norvegicus TaxID=10116 RepID=A6I659_RAT|nr:ankyrin repeat domain 42 (predicted), isoform CRA_b [Rattus norvegicus]